MFIKKKKKKVIHMIFFIRYEIHMSYPFILYKIIPSSILKLIRLSNPF